MEVPGDALDGEVFEHECGAMLEVVRRDGSLSLRPLEGVQEDWGE
jgi:alpha-aminoadipate carrier protein LysW